MTRNSDHAYDMGGQWSDGGRERHNAAWERNGSAKGRRRRAVKPVYSSDGERE